MPIASWSRKIFSNATPIVGAVTLGAIALVGVPESAQAASIACGPGANWVADCDPGSDHFPNSWAFIDVWLDVQTLEDALDLDIFPDTFDGHLVGQDALMLSGPVWVDRNEPIFDGQKWVIPTVLNHTLRGSHNLLGDLELVAEGTGEISQNPGDTGADSFFDVDFTLNAGDLSFFGSTTVVGDRDLNGVSPDRVENGVPFLDCPHDDPNAAIQYCNDSPNDLFINIDGQDILVGTFAETHIVHTPVPEPATIIGSTLALGFGALFKRKKQQQG